MRTKSETLKARRHRLKISVYGLRPRVPDPCFVLGAGRSGTNLLIDYMRCIPDVAMHREVLNFDSRFGLPPRASKSAAMQHIHRSLASLNGRVRGAKLLFYQLEDRRITLEEVCDRFSEARFVVLYRQSLAEAFLSNLVATKTGDFQGMSGPDKSTVVRVDPDELLTFCDRIRGYYQTALAVSAVRRQAAIVRYEDLRDRPQQVIDHHVAPFLALESVPVTTDRSKQIQRPLEEVVANYEEVAPLFSSERTRQSYR